MYQRNLHPNVLSLLDQNAFSRTNVFKNLPVRAELATAGNVMDCHLGPECCVLIGLAHHILGVDVGGVVGKGQESTFNINWANIFEM